MTYRTSAELAAELRCHPKTVLRRAKRLGIGLDLGGRYRFSDADVQRLLDSMRPAPTAKRRRRRAA